MGRIPSDRRNYRDPEMELNLTPMMNMIAILIPALLISVSFLEISALEAHAAASSDSSTVADAQLDLRVAITADGYRVETGLNPEPVVLPVAQRPIDCERFVGTWPPPRVRNADVPRCAAKHGQRQFWVYDSTGLHDALVVIKEQYPTVRQITIVAEPEISYEAVTDAMDASRSEGAEPLFDQMHLSPGLLGP